MSKEKSSKSTRVKETKVERWTRLSTARFAKVEKTLGLLLRVAGKAYQADAAKASEIVSKLQSSVDSLRSKWSVQPTAPGGAQTPPEGGGHCGGGGSCGKVG